MRNNVKHIKFVHSKDRLSDLHDDILIQVLAFLDAKSAARTCVLSKRWNNKLWIHHPDVYLNNKISGKTSYEFQKFVDEVLTQRDKLRIQGRSFSFTWTFQSLIPQHLIDKVHAHAQNHDVRHFDLRICGASCCRSHPSQNFNPKSLTTLRLNLSNWSREFLCSDAYYRNLHLYLSGCTALKTLWLEETCFAISSGDVDVFSSLVDLTELHIIGCNIIGKDRRFSVGAPRLERLTILQNISGVHWEISSRVLKYLRTDLCLSGPIIDYLPHCIEELEIDFQSIEDYINSGNAELLINTIRYLPHAESFTLSKSTLQVLSAFPEILESRVPPPLPLPDFKWKLLKVITKNELPIKDFPEYLPGLVALTKNCSETLKVEFV